MNLFRLSILLGFSFFLLGCPQPEPDFVHLPKDVQTISLLGDTLRSASNPLPENLSLRIDSLVQVARENNDSVSVTIWQARRLGYEGRYRLRNW